MIVKRSTLIKYCILITIVIVTGTISSILIFKKHKEQERTEQIWADYNRAVDREYKSLVREYESIIETIKDYDYSYSFRYRYVRKLNELLGINRYTSDAYSEIGKVQDCIDDLDLYKEEDLKTLKAKAYLKVIED